MRVRVQYRPLVWDLARTPDNQLRDRHVFKQTWTQIQELLDKELNAIAASEVTLELDVTEGAIRNDGGLRSGAGPGYQGIKLSFNLKDVGRLYFATDKHEFWQHNVYAIARALEALRLVERYGINKGDEQYTGFKAIESGNGVRRPAAVWVAKLIGYPDGPSVKNAVETLLSGNYEDRRKLIRAAQLKAHPDHNEGRNDMYQLLNEKLETLGVN